MTILPAVMTCSSRPPGIGDAIAASLGASDIAGSVAGLASVVILGWIQEGTLEGGIDLLTVATSPDLDVWSFVLAPLVSGAVALAVGRVTVPSAPIS